LLEASVDGARGVLLSVSGGSDLGLFEINEAARLVAEAAHPEANIIFGAVIDDALGDEVRVTVIAAGFDGGTPGPMRTASRRAEEATAAEESASATEAVAPPEVEEQRRIELPEPRERRTIVFDDAVGDELDVPDFLK
jgi:cell division protein FtsZ